MRQKKVLYAVGFHVVGELAEELAPLVTIDSARAPAHWSQLCSKPAKTASDLLLAIGVQSWKRVAMSTALSIWCLPPAESVIVKGRPPRLR